MQTVAGLERKIGNVDRMAEELHAIKGHAKNLGRTAAGRSAEEIDARDQTKGILAKIRAGMEYCKKVLTGMGQKILMARAHVVHLKLSAERKTEKVTTVQEIARELRDTSAMDFGRQLEPAQAR